MKETKKQLVLCDREKCPFGLKKFDEQCNLCGHHKLIVITASIEPMLINYSEDVIYECYKNNKLPMHQECVFKFKKPSEKCRGCVRMVRKVLHSKTEVIK